MQICYLGIGSNLGNRHKNIMMALQEINRLKGTEIIKSSKIIETPPCGGPKSQGKFLNAVLKIRTILPPFILLKKLKGIEKELGRNSSLRWGPRTIDLDILLYADKHINSRALKIPHPRILERYFVIKPLLETL